MRIIDTALSPNLFNTVVDKTYSLEIPWYYGSTAYTDSSDGFSWAHTVMQEGNKVSFLADTLELAIISALDNVEEKFTKIQRIRLGLLTITDENYTNIPHVDQEFTHKTGLLYLCDSDGSTKIYNEKYSVESMIPAYDYYKNTLKEQVSLLHDIDCRKNRMVLFDGLHYHSSTTPTDIDRRITLNFNYL
jgi:hypothetical protein